jgi:glycosyltransferase involved in cell wall biosynthesis
LAKKSNKLVTVGENVWRDLVHAGIGTPNQYVNIPPGITALKKIDKSEAREFLGLKTNELIFGYLGRLIAVKGPIRFIEITKKFPDINFALAGEGELFEVISKSAPANVKILGWVNSAKFMSAIDVLVATSESEGIPVALIEAAFAGVPVISTDVGSVSEVVINGKTGFVTSKDVDEIARAIRKFIADPILINAYGTNAKRFAASNYSVEKMVFRHMKLYEEIINI